MALGLLAHLAGSPLLSCNDLPGSHQFFAFSPGPTGPGKRAHAGLRVAATTLAGLTRRMLAAAAGFYRAILVFEREPGRLTDRFRVFCR